MKFAGIRKTSLIDYPDRISTVLFTPGCNLRCPFCHNWRIVLHPNAGSFLSEEKVLQVLKSRKKYVDTVVITGGEPTLHSDLTCFIKKLKTNEFTVKLDTNGFFPQVLRKCVPYVDYVAMDIKTSIEKYELLGARNIDDYLESINILKQGKVEYEFRTTAVPGFITDDNLPKMGELIKGAKLFAFQQFKPGDTLADEYKNVKPYQPEKLAGFVSIMKEYVKNATLRI